MKVLSVGATGSVGRHVVEVALERGHDVRALVRDVARASLPPGALPVVGDLTSSEDLAGALDGIDAIVFTQGTHGGAEGFESVDYGAVRNALDALDGRPVRIALMTAIGVTRRGTGHDWKRRAERLVRASGNDYTIVRPGWFDYNEPDELAMNFLQGDTRHAASPADGVIARRQIAQVLVDSLTSPAAARTTLELIAEKGPAPSDLAPLFAALDKDTPHGIDGVRDQDNQPSADEPERVRADLERVTHARRSTS